MYWRSCINKAKWIVLINGVTDRWVDIGRRRKSPSKDMIYRYTLGICIDVNSSLVCICKRWFQESALVWHTCALCVDSYLVISWRKSLVDASTAFNQARVINCWDRRGGPMLAKMGRRLNHWWIRTKATPVEGGTSLVDSGAHGGGTSVRHFLRDPNCERGYQGGESIRWGTLGAVKVAACCIEGVLWSVTTSSDVVSWFGKQKQYCGRMVYYLPLCSSKVNITIRTRLALGLT